MNISLIFFLSNYMCMLTTVLDKAFGDKATTSSDIDQWLFKIIKNTRFIIWYAVYYIRLHHTHTLMMFIQSLLVWSMKMSFWRFESMENVCKSDVTSIVNTIFMICKIDGTNRLLTCPFT